MYEYELYETNQNQYSKISYNINLTVIVVL